MFDAMATLLVTRGIARTFPCLFSETFEISKNEDFNSPYLENIFESFKNSFESVFRASESRGRAQLVSVFQLTLESASFCHKLRMRMTSIYVSDK